MILGVREVLGSIQMVDIAHSGDVPAFPDYGMAVAERAQAFHRTLPGYAPTPLISLDNLAGHLGLGGILVKDESKRFGLNAFKALGGSYAMSMYAGDGGKKTFVTATDGNHGRGVAWSARQMGHRAVVYMPAGSARERLENIRREGAQAEITHMGYDDTVRYAARRAQEEGWILLQDTSWPGYEAAPRRIMQGYTTMGAEILPQLGGRRPTHVFLQAGVGAMAGAMAGFFADVYGKDRPRIAVVEPHGANCLFLTAEAGDGRLHACPPPLESIMAGLCCGEVCGVAWEVLRDCADHAISIPDWAAANGMRALGNPLPGDAPITAGESGAATTGALLTLMTRPEGRPLARRLGLDEHALVLLINTEGDTDRENYRNIVWRGACPEDLRA